jgi:hypothetical protein
MANETIAIVHRWMDFITDKIGEAKIELADLYLSDGRTFRVRPSGVERYPEALQYYIDERELGDLGPGDERQDDLEAYQAQLEREDLERKFQDSDD